MIKQNGKRDENGRDQKCPFINNPFQSCYCYNMDSLRTEAALYYCGGNYEECRIYQENKTLNIG
jgi:hypothetical protein